MTLSQEAREFLTERRFAVLATVNSDGTPQQSVMWYELIGDTVVMNTLRGRIKYRNLASDGRASICVEDEQRYLAIRGSITVDEDPIRGQESVRSIATRYDGPEQAAEIMDSVFSKQHRVTLRMTIDRVDQHGFEE